MIFQAGDSEEGRDLGAEIADGIFTHAPTIEAGQAFYADIKARAAAKGRDPEHVVVMPGVTPILADTDEEARELEREHPAGQGLREDPRRSSAARSAGTTSAQYDLDAPFPELGDLGERQLQDAGRAHQGRGEGAGPDPAPDRRALHRVEPARRSPARPRTVADEHRGLVRRPRARRHQHARHGAERVRQVHRRGAADPARARASSAASTRPTTLRGNLGLPIPRNTHTVAREQAAQESARPRARSPPPPTESVSPGGPRTMSRPRTLFRLAALAATAALALAGCGGGSGAAPGTLTWGFNLPTSWDPVTSSTGNDINTVSLVYASLTQLDEKGNAGPGLAQSWTYNADGTAVTFTLRPGLTFTDGTPLNADAVKQSLLRGKTQQNSLLKDQLSTIKDITTSGDLDVTLNLAAPDFQVPNLLAGKTGAIVSPAAFTKDAAAIPTAPVGAGPFKFESFVPESKAVLVKNPGYWDAADIKLDRLVLTTGTDPSSVIAAVQTGSLDVATITGSQVAQAKAAGLDVEVIDSLTVNQVDVHSGLAPLTDRRSSTP